VVDEDEKVEGKGHFRQTSRSLGFQIRIKILKFTGSGELVVLHVMLSNRELAGGASSSMDEGGQGQ